MRSPVALIIFRYSTRVREARFSSGESQKKREPETRWKNRAVREKKTDGASTKCIGARWMPSPGRKSLSRDEERGAKEKTNKQISGKKKIRRILKERARVERKERKRHWLARNGSLPFDGKRLEGRWVLSDVFSESDENLTPPRETEECQTDCAEALAGCCCGNTHSAAGISSTRHRRNVRTAFLLNSMASTNSRPATDSSGTP